MKSTLLLLLFFVSISGFSQKLFEAVEKENTKKVNRLLDKGEDVNEYNANGLFPLWRAAADNNIEIATLLLANGASVNQASNVPPVNSIALELPCQEGYLEMVKLLVKHGADVNHKSYRDFTPVRIAARNGHVEIVKILTENGAEIDFQAMDGATALEHAASKGHLEVVNYLVKKGAKINLQDAEGDFALGEAAKRGYIDVMKVLIGNGADLTLQNGENKTAYDLAKERGQQKAALLLEKHINNRS